MQYASASGNRSLINKLAKLGQTDKENLVLHDEDFCRHMSSLETEMSSGEISIFFSFCLQNMLVAT